MQKWMALLSSTTWEEMKRNAEGDDIMSQVYNQARDIAKNDKKRIEVENRERWIWDQNSIKRYEREQGKIEMVKEMLLDGESISTIMKYSKFTEDKIKDIQKSL